jgi:hypothetical protein
MKPLNIFSPHQVGKALHFPPLLPTYSIKIRVLLLVYKKRWG